MKPNLLIIGRFIFSICHIFIFLICVPLLSQTCTPDLFYPSAICKTYTIVPFDGFASKQLNARLLDNGSNDNCTNREQLKFSYSPVSTDSILIFQSVSLHPGYISLFVTDEQRNTNSCKSIVIAEECNLPMSCKSESSFTLDKGQILSMHPGLILSTYCSTRNYLIEVIQPDGSRSELTQLSISHNNKTIEITDLQSGQKCQSLLKVSLKKCDAADYIEVTNQNFIRKADDNLSPSFVGFPSTKKVKITNLTTFNNYLIDFLDGCPAVLAKVKDFNTNGNCSLNYDRIISREWSINLSANQSYTIYQSILVNYGSIQDVYPLINYDNVTKKAIDCLSNYPKDINGNPDPSLTGILYPNVSKNLSINYIDSISFDTTDCQAQRIIHRKWQILDWCTGAYNSYLQKIIVACNADYSKPVANCLSPVTINFGSQDEIRLNAREFDNGSNDACSGITISFDRSGKLRFNSFKLEDTSINQTIKIYVSDPNGNIDSCAVQINWQHEIATATGNFGGTIYYYYDLSAPNNVLFLNASITQNGQLYSLQGICNSPAIPKINYTLCLDDKLNNSNFHISFHSNEDYTNGVTTADIVYIQQLILGIRTPVNIFQTIAADVNNSKSITAADIAQIRRLILGIIDTLPVDAWQFYNFDTIRIKKFSDVVFNKVPFFNADAVIVKSGDLNGSAKFHGLYEPIIKSRTADVEFFITDRQLVKDSVYEIWINSQFPVTFQAIQLGQYYDSTKIKILEIETPFVDITKDKDYRISHKEYRLLINRDIPQTPLTVKGDWLKIRVKAIADVQLKDVLYQDTRLFISELVEPDLTTYPVKILYKESTAINPENEISKFNLFPNPVSNELKIVFNQFHNSKTRIKICNALGQYINTVIISESIPENYIIINTESLPKSNIYFLQVINDSGIQTKSFYKN